jgi:two-component system capsular synthesis sensor histidine kinase RcsC
MCAAPPSLPAVSDVSANGTVLLYQSPGAPGYIAGAPPVTTDVAFLGRTWRVVVSPSRVLADATTTLMLSRTVGFVVPVSICAVSCIVLIALFVRRNRLDALSAKSFEAYVRARVRVTAERRARSAMFGGPSLTLARGCCPRQVGYVLHELRNPLHGIRGALDLCRSPDVTPADTAELLASMQSGVDLMVTITSDLLDLEKLRSGRFEVNPAPVPLHALVHDVAAAARPACRGSLTVVINPDVPATLVTDGGRLRQVLANGLSNACKHATTVTLSVTVTPGQAAAAAPGSSITLRVLDDGPGLQGVDMDRLFDDFSAAANAVGTRGEGGVRGSGLGLPICARLTTLLGGALTVRDRRDGVRGVEFAVRLPCDAAPRLEAVFVPEPLSGPPTAAVAAAPLAEQQQLQQQQQPPQQTGSPQAAIPARRARQHTVSDGCASAAAAPVALPPPLMPNLHRAHSASVVPGDEPVAPARRDAPITSAAPAHPRRRIMIVDDAPLNRRIAERYVTSLGHECVCLTDGDEVAPCVLAGAPPRPDLILMDIRMVRMDGDAACRLLRAGGYTGPIIAVSRVRVTVTVSARVPARVGGSTCAHACVAGYGQRDVER